MLTEEEIRRFKSILKDVQESSLELEVIEWALLAMKNNPSLSVLDAMEEGYDEWVK